MTTDRATPDSPSAARAPRGPSNRTLALLVAAVVLGLGWYFRKPLVLWSMWVNGADRREYYDKLMQEQDPAVLKKLEAGMRDEDKGDVVRLACANLLMAKNRLGIVEAGLRDPRLDVRAVAMAALGNQKHFRSEYVDNPAFGVAKTLIEWIADPKSPSRARGIGMLGHVFPPDQPLPPELLAALRAALAPSDATGAADTRAAAAAKLAWLKDCASGPALVALSATEPEPYTRWLIMRSTVQLFDTKVQLPDGSFSKGPDGNVQKACPDLPEAALRTAVVDALARPGGDDHNRGLRMGAMGIMARHPEWSAEALDRIRGILGNPSGNEVERRTALETLVALKDASTLDRFERWFHDPSGGVRATATSSITSKAEGLDPSRFLACVVGYLHDEPVSAYQLTFNLAYGHVRQKAGEWVGLPGTWRAKGGSLGDIQEGLLRLQKEGSLDGTTRAQVGDALFRWLAGKVNGLTDAEVDAALKVRAEFWAKARAGDVAGARAVHDASMQRPSNLWTYELGWIESRTK